MEGARRCERCGVDRALLDFGSPRRKRPRKVCRSCVAARRALGRKRRAKSAERARQRLKLPEPSPKVGGGKGRQKLKELGFFSYRRYMRSNLWRSIRRRKIKQDGPFCAACSCIGEDVHHRSYSRAVLRGDDLSQLILLCRACHRSIEFDEKGEKRSSVMVEKALVRLLRRSKAPDSARAQAGEAMPHDGGPCTSP